MNRLLLFCTLAALACAETGQDHGEVPLYVAGSTLDEPVVAQGGVAIRIDRAELAFGPLYLCAGYTAGDLCDTARLEWLDSIVIDTLADKPVRAGDLVGITGKVQSWMYDLGISSQLTDDDPYVLKAAASLGNSSFVLAGRADVDGVELPFFASIPVQQTSSTELGVPVVRKSASDSFNHEVTAAESGLLVRFNIVPWLRNLDLRAYVEDKRCEVGGNTFVCAGMVQQTCAEDGLVRSTQDCRDRGQVCVAGVGCTDELVLDAESEAFRSLHNALVAGARPTFAWNYKP